MSLARLRALSAHLSPRPAPATAAGLATEAVIHNDNVACCTVPAAASAYEPRGTFVPFAGFSRVYTTGPAKASTAIICIHDVFGFKPQTQQGADMLAQSLGARVVMPDFFEPVPAWDTARHPPQTDEDKRAFQAFFAGPANPVNAVEKLERVARALRAEGVKKVGAYGLCWGGKVVILTGSKKDTVLDAIASVHPAMLKADDAAPINIPLAIYVTKDEPHDQYTSIVNSLKSKPFADKSDNYYYPTMFHGFAGARAKLDDPENKRLFDDAYARLARYFKQNFGI